VSAQVNAGKKANGNGNGLVSRGDGVFEASGRMTFQTVPQFLASTAIWLNDTTGAVTIDLGKITLADSAGVALMLEWLREARVAKRKLEFVNFPEQVQHLIRVSGLSDVFGLA